MQRTYTIITTCKGRLEQLKISLPQMVAQDGAEVIVVDYDCPERAGEFVRREFPSVKVVSVEGESYFSNWRARNRGAEAATTDMLVFCDVDTVLATGAIGTIDASLPPKSYGRFGKQAVAHFVRPGPRLQQNQFRGFQVVPAAAFRRLGGYDEVLEGYAAGGDTDLEDRLIMIGTAPQELDPNIVRDFVPHDNKARIVHHKEPLQVSYPAGMLYRQAKLALMAMKRTPSLPLELRRRVYRRARNAVERLAEGADKCSMTVFFQNQPVGMPRQLGFDRGSLRTAIHVEITLEEPIDQIPE